MLSVVAAAAATAAPTAAEAATATAATASAAVATTAAATTATTAAAAEATTTATTAAATTATTTAATTGAAVLGLVHAHGAPVELLAVHAADGGLGVPGIVERDEAEAARPTGLAIHDHLRVSHGPEALERLTQPLIRRAPSKAANKQFLRHDDFRPCAIGCRVSLLGPSPPSTFGGTAAPSHLAWAKARSLG